MGEVFEFVRDGDPKKMWDWYDRNCDTEGYDGDGLMSKAAVTEITQTLAESLGYGYEPEIVDTMFKLHDEIEALHEDFKQITFDEFNGVYEGYAAKKQREKLKKQKTLAEKQSQG